MTTHECSGSKTFGGKLLSCACRLALSIILLFFLSACGTVTGTNSSPSSALHSVTHSSNGAVPGGGSGSGDFQPADEHPVKVSIVPSSAAVKPFHSLQFTVTVNNTHNTAVTWSATQGTISDSGLYTAPSVSRSITAIVTAISESDPRKSARSVVTIEPDSSGAASTLKVTINPSTAIVKSAQEAQFTAAITNTSDTAVTWSATQGTISNTGLYTAPAVSKITPVIVTATSVSAPGKSATALLTITSGSGAALSINTSSIPNATADVSYATTVSASGGVLPYSWSISAGGLPAGISPSSGVISGTTTQTGQFHFTLQATDSSSPAQTASAQLTLTVLPGVGPGSGIPASFFGMHMRTVQDWLTAPIGALGKASAVNWEYTEPYRGVFNWSRLDQWVDAAHQHGVSFYFSNDAMPAWAVKDTSTCQPAYSGATILRCRSMVANIGDWDDFVTALATRYKGRLNYELWNEPSASSSLTVADLVTLTTREYNIIRSLDPQATIVCCGFVHGGNFQYMDQFFAAGGTTGVDAFSFHGIFSPPAQPPEWIVSETDRAKQILAKYGLSNKPLWDTEGGWAVLSPPVRDDQPAFVTKWFLLQWSLGVSRAYWYSWSTWRPLWDTTTGITPAGVAYEQVYNWMVGATLDKPCSVTADSVWTCVLTRPGGYQAQVTWDASATRAYIPDSQYKQYRDLSGKTTAIPAGSSLIIGPTPTILETFSP